MRSLIDPQDELHDNLDKALYKQRQDAGGIWCGPFPLPYLSISRLVPIVGRDAAGCDIRVADLSETQRSFDHLVAANGHSQYLHGPALNSPVRMRGGAVAA